MEKIWLTLPEAANQLELSADTIRRWAKKGLIKAGRNNLNHRIFNEDELIRAKSKYLGQSERPRELVMHKSKATSFSALELFSGCGGMALGLKNAGFKTKLLVENNKHACATLRKNNSKWQVVEEDIFKLNEESFFDKFYGKADLVAGGFPCQSFSYAGKGLGFGDPRGTLFFEFLKCIKSVQPKIALGENVRGLLKHDQGKTLATIVSYLEDAGYDTVYHVMRAQFYDVPQKRERLVIMGIRKDLGLKHLFPREKDYTLTLRDAFKNVPDSLGQRYPEKKRKVMELVPSGGYWRDLPIEIQKEYMQASYFHTGGRTGMARRLAWDEPSLTLTCAPAQKQTERCHPEETRPLSVREYARLQTFPDSWEFAGSANDQYKQIGNAVPVNLGYFIGRAVLRTLQGKPADKDFFIKTKESHSKAVSDQMELFLAG